MENNELYHHGVKGMRWGVRRTPKQLGHTTPNKKRKPGLPLFKKKKPLTAAEKKAAIEAKKEKVLKSRSPKELYENAHLFSTQELQTAYNRLQLEKNIKNLSPKEVSKGEEYANKFTKFSTKTSEIAESGSRLYDNVAKIYNAFNKKGNKLPLINAKGDKKKNNDDGDEDTPKTNTKKKSSTVDGTVEDNPSSEKASSGSKFKFKRKDKKSDTVIDAEWEDIPADDVSEAIVKKGEAVIERLIEGQARKLLN